MALLAAAPAHAQDRDPAAAEALFQAGRKAYDVGSYAEACRKFSESQRLDPGAGTLINLAACREKTQELSLAWEAWQEALRALPQGDERRPEVEHRAKTLDARLPRLVVVLAPNAPTDARITRDGVLLGSAALGVPIPVDPGKHTVEVNAAGRASKRYQITIAEGAKERLEVTPGDVAASPPPTPAPPPKALKPTPANGSRPERDRGGEGETRTLGFIVGGVGAAGVVVGGVTGLLALGKKHTMDDDCDAKDGVQYCGQAGLDAASSGKTLATVSTVSFVAGTLALGVGAYFVLTSDSGSTTTVSTRLVPGGGGFGLARSF
jgi:hypothetical protein